MQKRTLLDFALAPALLPLGVLTVSLAQALILGSLRVFPFPASGRVFVIAGDSPKPKK